MRKGEIAWNKQFLLFSQCFIPYMALIFHFKYALKVALQILGRKFYKNTKKSTLYSQSFLIFIHKTPVVENQPTTGENRELLRPALTPTGIMVYFYMSSSLIYILEIHTKTFDV